MRRPAPRAEGPARPWPPADAAGRPRNRAARRMMPAAPALPHPDWLYHHLRVTGAPAEVAAFRAAAAGAGVIPWAARPRPGGGGLVPSAGGAAGAAAAQPQPGGLPHPRRPAARRRRGAAAPGGGAGGGQPGLPARPAPAAARPRPAAAARAGAAGDPGLALGALGHHPGAARRGGAAGARAAARRGGRTLDSGGWASGRPTGRPGAAILAAPRPLAGAAARGPAALR